MDPPNELVSTGMPSVHLMSGDLSTEINYVITGLAAISFLLSAMLLIYYSKTDSLFLGAPVSCGILFFSGFVILIAVLSMKEENFYMMFILGTNVVVGIVLSIYGSFVFFKSPIQEERSLTFNDKSISFIMVGITVPLCLMEMVLAVVSAKHDVWHAAAVSVTVMQKLIQVGVYHFSIRHKVPANNRHHGASWYLKIMALFNFLMWLHALIDGSATMNHSMKPVLTAGASMVSAVYASLVVDYRMLCLLLYLELALDVDNWNLTTSSIENETTEMPSWQPPRNLRKFRIAASQYSGVGYLVGILVVLGQITVAIQVLKNDQGPVGPCLFGMLADLLVIIPGVVLVRMAQYPDNAINWREESSKAVNIMVASMGMVGMVYWILRSTITMLLTAQTHNESARGQHLLLMSIPNGVRILGILFQLSFFYRITPSIGIRTHIRKRRIAYLLVPLIMLAQISVFVNTVVDSYRFVVEEQVHHAQLSSVVVVVFKIGEPLHLGFCLHMFFHFLFINNNLRRKDESQPEQTTLEAQHEDFGEEDDEAGVERKEATYFGENKDNQDNKTDGSEHSVGSTHLQ